MPVASSDASQVKFPSRLLLYSTKDDVMGCEMLLAFFFCAKVLIFHDTGDQTTQSVSLISDVEKLIGAI